MKKQTVKSVAVKSNINAVATATPSVETPVAVVAAAGADLYTRCVEILTANAATPMNVLAGKLKVSIAEAQILLRQYRSGHAAEVVERERPRVNSNSNGHYSPLKSLKSDQKELAEALSLTSKKAPMKSAGAEALRAARAKKVKPPTKVEREADREETHKVIAAAARKAGAAGLPKEVQSTAQIIVEEEAKAQVMERVAKKAASEGAITHEEAEEIVERNAERLTELASKVAQKKAEPKPVTPPDADLINRELAKSKFTFVQAVQEGTHTAYGYVHPDGRAVMYIPGSGYKMRTPNGVERSGASVKELQAHIVGTATKSLCNKAAAADQRRAKKLADAQAKAEAAVAEGTSVLDTLGKKTERVETVDGVPVNVMRAVEMLGGVTLQRFNLDLLRGDKYYGARMSLLKKLFNRDRVLAKECGIQNLEEAFYSAVGCGGLNANSKNKAARAENFARRCKELVTKMRTIKSAATREEKKHITAVKRATVLDRIVPGSILMVDRSMSKKDREAHDAAAKREALYALVATTGEQYPVPRPDAEVTLDKDSIRLLEDPGNGIAFLQIEHANSQGAICVYNNGRQVACGVISTASLKRLRPISKEVDLVKAVNQLLNPFTPGVPVTPVAHRHLTAVLNHCKEIIEMETKAKKFAAPAKKSSAAKAEKATPKASKKAVAAGKHKEATEKAPRSNGYAGKTIKVVNKEHGAREGSKRAIGLDAIFKSKTTDEAIAKLEKVGADTSFIRFAVNSGYIKLS